MDNLKKIISPIDIELALFEKELKNRINSSDNFLKDDLTSFMFNNPKRLRPVFVFLFSKILKINNPLTAKIALIVELIHNASLVHDDIIDKSKLRRNLPTFYDKYGTNLAVLEGDLLLSFALEELSYTTLDIIKIFSKRITSTLEGEINQNSALNKAASEKEYIKRTLNKTGNLFMAGLEALFTLNKIDEKIKNALIAFIKNYSTAFQIQNDIENIKSDNSDFNNGNYTLAVIYFFCDNENKKPKKKDLLEYLKKAEEKKDYYLSQAYKSLDNIESSIYKDSILNLCAYTLRS